MIRNGQNISFSTVLTRLVLSCFLLVLVVACSETDFDRDMQFNDQWRIVSTENQESKSKTLINHFDTDLQDDKLYLLQVASEKEILHAYINNTFITGSSTKNNQTNFNITNYLKGTNTIELTFNDIGKFNAEIYRVNKLFIPHIYLNAPNAGETLVEVQVKNVFNTEKQGVLEYTLYSNDKKLFKKETPVFISGNAENLYRQYLPFDKNMNDTKGLKVVCRLFSNGKLLDKNSDTLPF